MTIRCIRSPAHAAAVAAHAGLREVLTEREATWERDFLLNLIPLGAESPAGGIPPLPKALFHAATLAYDAGERAKPEVSRTTGSGDADQSKIRDRLRREQSQYVASADHRVFAALVRRALALPQDQRIAAVDSRFGGMSPVAIERTIAQMYASSTVLDADNREAMLGESADALSAHKEAMLDFGRAWANDVRALRERDWNARAAVHRPHGDAQWPRTRVRRSRRMPTARCASASLTCTAVRRATVFAIRRSPH